MSKLSVNSLCLIADFGERFLKLRYVRLAAVKGDGYALVGSRGIDLLDSLLETHLALDSVLTILTNKFWLDSESNNRIITLLDFFAFLFSASFLLRASLLLRAGMVLFLAAFGLSFGGLGLTFLCLGGPEGKNSHHDGRHDYSLKHIF